MFNSSGMRDSLGQLILGPHGAFGITGQHMPWNTWARTCQSPQEGRNKLMVSECLSDVFKTTRMWINVCRMWQVPVHHRPGPVLVQREASLLLPKQMQQICVFSLHPGTNSTRERERGTEGEREREKWACFLFPLRWCGQAPTKWDVPSRSAPTCPCSGTRGGRQHCWCATTP